MEEQLKEILERLDSLASDGESREDADIAERMDALETKLDAILEKMDGDDKREDEEDEYDESREDAAAERIAFANERRKVLNVADQLDLEVDEEADNADLKRAIVAAQRPDNERVDSASDEYVDAIFDEIEFRLEDESDDEPDTFARATRANRKARNDARDNQGDGENINDAFFSKFKDQ